MALTQYFFHGSLNADIKEFLPLTHFGTYKAAYAAIIRKIKDQGQVSDVGYIYKVCIRLNTSKFSRIEDPLSPRPNAILNSTRSLDDKSMLKYKDELSNAQAMEKEETSKRKNNEEIFMYLKSRNYISRILEDNNIAGLIYSNKVEDKGKDSIIVVDPRHITIKDIYKLHMLKVG